MLQVAIYDNIIHIYTFLEICRPKQVRNTWSNIYLLCVNNIFYGFKIITVAIKQLPQRGLL